jgi:hypothetical protein
MKIIITESQLKTLINEGSNTITSDGISKGVNMVKKLMSKLGIGAKDASAIAGNMWHESHFNPAAMYGQTYRTPLSDPEEERSAAKKAYGLIQWANVRREALKDKSKEDNRHPANTNFQLDYLKQELEGGESSNFDKVKNEINVSDKAKTFSIKVERSGESDHSNRIDAAEKIYDEYIKSKKEIKTKIDYPKIEPSRVYYKEVPSDRLGSGGNFQPYR